MRLTNHSFTVLAEGEHIFRCYGVDSNEKFGTLTLNFINAKGLTHRETYRFLRPDKSPNEGALAAFSYLARVAMHDMDRDEIEPEELMGKYIKMGIIHNEAPSTKTPGETVIFTNSTSKYMADGFDEPATDRALNLNLPVRLIDANGKPKQPCCEVPAPTVQMKPKPEAKPEAKAEPTKGFDLSMLD